MRCRYNAVNFLQNPHNRHSIGVSFVNLYSALVNAAMRKISCYTWSRYKGRRLYSSFVIYSHVVTYGVQVTTTIWLSSIVIYHAKCCAVPCINEIITLKKSTNSELLALRGGNPSVVDGEDRYCEKSFHVLTSQLRHNGNTILHVAVHRKFPTIKPFTNTQYISMA